MKKYIKYWFEKLNNAPLWIFGIVIAMLWFAPYVFWMGESVFPVHDQLDETLLAYVLNARHLFDGSSEFKEILGGLNKTGLQPSAPLFVLLYTFLSPFVAFVLQYVIVFITAFFGMYFCVYEIGKSNILSLAIATCFAALPYPPIYGTSVICVPAVLLALLFLYQKKNIILSYCILLYISVTSHLVLIGFVLLGLWALFLLTEWIRHNRNIHIYAGFVVLLTGYILMNFSLFYELFFGQGNYVSHREEFVNDAFPFWETVQTSFIYGDNFHSSSLHTSMIIPILVCLILGGIFYKKMSPKGRQIYWCAQMNFVFILCIVLLCGFFSTEFVAAWQNAQTGILHYFTFQRISWVIPASWYLEACLAIIFMWNLLKEKYILQTALLAVMLVPTLLAIGAKSYLYMNIDRHINGNKIIGLFEWDSFYSEDLFEEIDAAIGEDKSTYRVVHLGINPAPAIMHGFYTVDGYSNNYPLEYKYQFREVIAKELDKNEYCRIYYDTWGSRVYLFNHVVGNTTFLGKGNGVVYEDLDFNLDALYHLGCRYIFSSSQIIDAEEMNVELVGYFETETSYWGIWVYKLENK